MSSFGDRLKQLQRDRMVLKKDVANAIGISSVNYYRYETGQRTPSVDMLLKLSTFFHVSTDWLLCISDDQTIHSPAQHSDEEAAALEQVAM